MDVGQISLAGAPAVDQSARAGPPRFTFERPRRGPWLQLGTADGFEWNRLDVLIDDLPDALFGLRVLHVSDLHLKRAWHGAYDALLARVRENPPDLILVTGDFVDDRMDHRAALPTAQRLVSGLTSRLGTFAILGNHDGDLLGPRLIEWGVRLVNGRTALLESADAALEIVGVPSVHRRDLTEEFIASLGPRRPAVPRIVLSHYPDSIRKLAALECDLILAGHTHGGQVCLPGGFPLITHDKLPRRMSRGIHAVGEKLLVISRGFGFADMPVRAFCPSEVVEIRFVPQRPGRERFAFAPSPRRGEGRGEG